MLTFRPELPAHFSTGTDRAVIGLRRAGRPTGLRAGRAGLRGQGRNRHFRASSGIASLGRAAQVASTDNKPGLGGPFQVWWDNTNGAAMPGLAGEGARAAAGLLGRRARILLKNRRSRRLGIPPSSREAVARHSPCSGLVAQSVDWVSTYTLSARAGGSDRGSHLRSLTFRAILVGCAKALES